MKASTSAETPVFELKGSVLTVLVLHIKQIDPDCLYPQLEKKIGQARSFFSSAPILLDLSAVDEDGQAALDIKLLADTLRGLSLVPVGVRGGAAGQRERVLQAGLGLLPSVKTEKSVATSPDPQPAEPASPAKENSPDLPAAAADENSAAVENSPDPPAAEASKKSVAVATKVVTHPVRSGQQVFAPEGDLVILSSVNPGAEVLAAGSIHIYGALRGRAMAGINGDVTARIFSLQCNAELVAVAGEYAVNESLDTALLNQSVIVSLKDNALDFQAIGSFKPLS